MGETQNTTTTGQARMTFLCHNKALEEKYKGKVYTELNAVDQQHIDMAYDAMMKKVKGVQVSAKDVPAGI